MTALKTPRASELPLAPPTDLETGRASDAQQLCDLIRNEIAKLERELAGDQAIAVRALLGDGGVIDADQIRCEGAHYVVVHGLDSHGHEARAIVPVNVLRVVLSKVKQGSVGVGTAELFCSSDRAD
jgi:hypothetical protein